MRRQECRVGTEEQVDRGGGVAAALSELRKTGASGGGSWTAERGGVQTAGCAQGHQLASALTACLSIASRVFLRSDLVWTEHDAVTLWVPTRTRFLDTRILGRSEYTVWLPCPPIPWSLGPGPPRPCGCPDHPLMIHRESIGKPPSAGPGRSGAGSWPSCKQDTEGAVDGR